MINFHAASLIQYLVIFVLRSLNDAQVEAAVGLYGPDRYEGLPDICLMPMEFGYCRAKVQRYYFDIRRMKCTMFYWGGCAGNDNNFKSIEECNDFCTSPYEDHAHNDVIVKDKRTESRGGTASVKYNAINSRDSSISKSVPKLAPKPNVTSKETNGYKSSFKASAKSFNVSPAPKLSSTNNNNNNNNSNNNNKPNSDVVIDEDYDD